MEKCGKHLIQLNYRNYQQKKINDNNFNQIPCGWGLRLEVGLGRWEGWKVESRKPEGEPPKWVNDTRTMWLI